MSAHADRIEEEILRQVANRGPDKTICPSEVSRALFAPDWREQMSAVRAVARQLAFAGNIRISQGGKSVNLDDFRGPIRLGAISPDLEVGSDKTE